MPNVPVIYQNGAIKGIDFSAFGGFEGFLNATSDGAGGSDFQVLRQAVPWYQRGVSMTGNAVATLPYTISAGGEDNIDDDTAWGGVKNPGSFLRKIAGSLCGGRAYARMKLISRGIVTLDYCIPSSITEQYNPDGTINHFIRTVKSGKSENIDPKDMLYFWLDDDTVETGPAQIYPLKNAESAAELMYAMNNTLGTYARRGFIKPIVGQAKGLPAGPERDRSETVLSNFVQGAWKRVVKLINAESMTLQELGVGMDELRNTYKQLNDIQISSIGASFGIPPSLFLSDDPNRATQNTNRKIWYESGEFVGIYVCIQNTLNDQLWKRFGWTMTYNPEELDAFKDNEIDSSSAFSQITDTISANPEAALIVADILGLDLTDEQIAAIEELANKPEPTPPPAVVIDANSQDVTPDSQLNADEQATADAMMKWQRFAEKKFDKRTEFENKSIPPKLVWKTRSLLRGARTVEEIPALMEMAMLDYPALILAQSIDRLQKDV